MCTNTALANTVSHSTSAGLEYEKSSSAQRSLPPQALSVSLECIMKVGCPYLCITAVITRGARCGDVKVIFP